MGLDRQNKRSYPKVVGWSSRQERTTWFRDRGQEIEAQPVAAIRTWTEPDGIAITLAEIFEDITIYLATEGIEPAGPPFTRYYIYRPDFIELEAGLPVAAPVVGKGRIAGRTLPGGRAVVTWHVGGYESLGKTYEAVKSYMRAQRIEGTADMWEVYWSDPGSVPDPSELKTQVIWPVKAQD
jgi:effector-binding domain-containing protein